MKVLIVGGGGREHALAWKCAQSPRVERVFVAPGNAGTAREPKVQQRRYRGRRHRRDCSSSPCASASSSPSWDPRRRSSPASSIDSPQEGRACFGPSRAAARLEGSKAYTKEFLQRHGIPTAGYATFTAADFDPDFVRAQRLPVVVKADGLAAGKGVVICETHEAAIETAQRMLGGLLRCGRQHHRDRGIPARRGSELHRRRGRRPGRSARHLARSQAPRRWRSAARTPAAWAPIRPRRSSRPICMRASCAR